MYSKLYFIIYSFFKSKKNHDPVFNCACLVFIAQLVHVFLLLQGIKYLIDFDIPKYSSNSDTNKLAFFPIGIIWLIIVHYFFKNRIDKMSKKYSIPVISKMKFIILLIIVIILPLYGVIKLSGGDVWQ